MANFLTNLLSGGASSLVDAVGNAIDKNFTTDAERKSLDNELAKAQFQYDIDKTTLGIKETEAYLGDVDSARKREVEVEKSESASWLAKNIQPGLAIAIVALTFWLYWYVLFGGQKLTDDPSLKDIVVYILGALTTVASQVVSYYFGSSKGSADKTVALREELRGKNKDN